MSNYLASENFLDDISKEKKKLEMDICREHSNIEIAAYFT